MKTFFLLSYVYIDILDKIVIQGTEHIVFHMYIYSYCNHITLFTLNTILNTCNMFKPSAA